MRMNSATIKVKSPAKILNKAGKERRSVGKVLNLAATYGMSGKTAGIRLGYEGDEAKEKGEELLNNFFTGFSGVKKAIDDSKEFLKKNGYVEDFIGRRRHLPDINLPAYTAEMKDSKNGTDANFNPILGCANRTDLNAPNKIWEEIVKRYAKYVNDFQASKAKKEGKEVKPSDEIGNKTYEHLQKIALNPKSEKNKPWNEKSKLTAAQKIKQITGLDIPDEPVILHANTGRRAQAERQCFNARIQGCLDYNSVICTKDGFRKIGDLANQTIEVFDGESWSSAVVLPSGKKQKCILTTGTGNTIICSPDHRFFVAETSGKKSFKKLSELKKQDRLIYTISNPDFTNQISLRAISGINYQKTANQNSYSFDDITNAFIRGQLLGRLASDGSYTLRTDGGSTITFLVATHELSVLDWIIHNIPWKYSIHEIQKKNQKIYCVTVVSKSLVEECLYLNIKHDLHDYFMSNSNVLRGFISGFFDGDGCSADSNHNINLVFGIQADFTNITNKLSMALSMLGIRNSIRHCKDRTRIDIKRADSELFAKRIGFINSEKQKTALAKHCIKDNHVWQGLSTTTIKTIIITDEFIDMYDVCNTERGYFVVNGLITHNSAASLTKLAMIDIYNDPRLREYDTHLIIPVHDELLVECPAYYADKVEKILPEIMVNAAKKGGDDVPQACDPYNVYRWYSDEICATLIDEFKKLEAGDPKKGVAPKSKEEALEILYKNHCEFPPESILKVITGEENELIFD